MFQIVAGCLACLKFFQVVKIGLCSSGCYWVVSSGFPWCQVVGGFVWVRLFDLVQTCFGCNKLFLIVLDCFGLFWL